MVSPDNGAMGDTVLYLGFRSEDVFLAEKRTGSKGQVIGFDISLDKICLARHTATERNLRPQHVVFVQATPTGEFPVLSNSIDWVLSTWSTSQFVQAVREKLLDEIFRVVKPRGRVMFKDTIAFQPIPGHLRAKLVADVAHIFNDNGYTELMNSTSIIDALNGKHSDNPLDSGIPSEQAVYYSFHVEKPPRREELDGQSPPETALRDWWIAYPAPSSEVPSLDCDDVATLVKRANKEDYVVIDVRRNDRVGGHVRGSAQHPAQTFYDELPTFHKTFQEKKQVIFYCGSSNGRGPRCAKWYQDYLNEVGNTHSKAYILSGGIKEWKKRFGSDEELVDWANEE
ncbi:Rhodanese-like domain-containing protein [Scleroderma citrinum]